MPFFPGRKALNCTAISGRRPAQRSFYFPVGLVLAQRIHRPNGGWQPANQRHLQYQANDAGNGPPYGEKGDEGQEYGEQQAHEAAPSGKIKKNAS
jgi:hypothetical protein